MSLDTLPPGYTSRPSRLEDADAIAALVNASSIEAFGEPDMSADEWRATWSDPARDLEHRSVVVVGPDGTLAAALDVISDPPFTEPMVFGVVAQEHRGRGLGTTIVGLGGHIAQAVVTAAPPDSTPVLRWWVMSGNADAASLLERHGFRPVRHFWLMRVSLEDVSPDPPVWPPGITVRTFDRNRDERAVYDAVIEGFADHWGAERATFESFVHRSIEAAGDSYEPSLWFLAMAGDAIAGLAICEPSMTADANSGYVADLAVRPAYRRRGIARALLLYAFDQFRSRGRARVALHVDASNPTGATRLYESVGMTPLPRGEVWERPLEGAVGT